MSLFEWFSSKPQAQPSSEPESPDTGPMANRKTERLERREMLYAIVRQSMTRAGVLSSSYKFKVLSLDSRGRQYLIMMDIARQYAGETARLAEIEGEVAKSAKTQHDILVTSVYWRVNEHVITSLAKPEASVSSPAPLGAASAAAPLATSAPPKSRFEPLQADEVAAFKQALAHGAGQTPSPQRGETVQSSRRNPSPPPVFQDTQIDDNHSPLSRSQYGDLI